MPPVADFAGISYVMFTDIAGGAHEGGLGERGRGFGAELVAVLAVLAVELEGLEPRPDLAAAEADLVVHHLVEQKLEQNLVHVVFQQV